MLIQGNLQLVFDALYEIGVIDPVLDRDWQEAMDERDQYVHQIDMAVQIVNRVGHERGIMIRELKKLDSKTLEYLAMEVAREFAEYHSRKQIH